MSDSVFLKLYKDDVVLQIKQVDTDQVSIGNSPDAQVYLEGADDSIMAWHALIEKQGENYKISDLGSSVGTYVNDEPIVEKLLSHGDVIKVANYKIEFFVGVPFVGTASSQIPVAPKEKAKPKIKPVATKKTSKPAQTPPVKPTPSMKSASPVKKPAPQKPVTPPKKVTKTAKGEHPWKQFLPFRTSKKTFAPPSSIKDLDSIIQPSSGSHVEIVVAWGERIITTYHSKQSEIITIGSSDKATIQVPNLLQEEPYPLVRSGQIAQITFPQEVKGKIITQKRAVSFDLALKKGVITQNSTGQNALSLGQNEVVRVDFHPMLSIYIRHTSATAKAPRAGVFDFNESELLGLGIALCFMMVFLFYIGIYYPRYMSDIENIDQKKIRIATIDLKPPVRKKPKPLKLNNKAVRVQKKANIPAVTKPKKKVVKKAQVKKQGKLGVAGGVKQKPKTKKPKPKALTSARSGRSAVKAKKRGSRAKSPKPDPTKVGLLGVFGKGGVKKKLDKTVSGAGELAGLADKSSGFSGNKDVYQGEGVGTKFKDVGAGGTGANLIGISGVSTKGQGGGTKGFGRGGSLGTKGKVDLSFGTEDIDVEGNVDENVIRRVISRNKRQLESCYSMVLQTNSAVQGRIRLQWEIEGVSVGGVWIKENKTGSSPLARCVINRLKQWRFPGAVPSGSKALVTFPFVFIEG